MNRIILVLLAAFLVAMFAASAQAEVFFRESFDDMSRWTVSKAKSDYGEWKLSAGEWYGDAEKDRGLKASQDARHYAISAPLDKPIETTKDKTLVVQYSVKWGEQGIDCGGAYIKLLPSSVDAASFTGDSPYELMFGPDVCGATKRVHAIFSYKGKNLLWKKAPLCETDKATHIYTLVVRPDNTYEMLIDGVKKESGSLLEDWDFLPAKEIPDPSDTKPADWVDAAEMPDPEDKKPEDWDKEPKFIADPAAKKPEDWDDAEDGAWEAPKIANPAYKGEWKARMIPNPAYKGEWKQKLMPNPEYVEDKEVYRMDNVARVGFEIWTVKGGQQFDNILVTDEESVAAAERTEVLARVAEEKKMIEAKEEADRKKAEEERKKQEEEDRKRREEEEAKKKAEEEAKKAAEPAASSDAAAAAAASETKEAPAAAAATGSQQSHDEL